AGSPRATIRPHGVLLSLDLEQVAASVPLDASPGDVATQVQHRVTELRMLWRVAADRLGCSVIQQTIPNLAPRLFGSFDGAVAGTASPVIDQLNRALVSDAARARVAVLDLASCAARLGQDAWFDPGRWCQAKQPASRIL